MDFNEMFDYRKMQIEKAFNSWKKGRIGYNKLQLTVSDIMHRFRNDVKDTVEKMVYESC